MVQTGPLDPDAKPASTTFRRHSEASGGVPALKELTV